MKLPKPEGWRLTAIDVLIATIIFCLALIVVFTTTYLCGFLLVKTLLLYPH